MKLAALGLGLSFWLLAQHARAVECDSARRNWIDRCSHSGVSFEPVSCPPGGLVVRAPSAQLDVELAAASERSFRRVGSIGLSPVGEFADWSKVSQEKQRALAALERCVASDPVPLDETPAPWRAPAPWLFLVALASSIGVACRSVRRRDLLVALALAVGTWAFRWTAIPRAFFHQNGQGPAWVGVALHEDVGLSSYGPGATELFGIVARIGGRHPEAGVWLFQSLLAASAVAAVFSCARHLGVKRIAAIGVALPFALDPALGRLAQSESYFASIASLLALGFAALALAGPRVRSFRFALAVAAAGFFVAQAARIHPVAWPAAVFAPLPILLGPGSMRRRVRLTVIASAAIASIVALTSAPSIAGVLRGPIGQQWLGPGAFAWRSMMSDALVSIILIAVAVAVVVRGLRGVTLAGAIIGVTWFSFRADVLSNPNPAVTAAHYRLYWPAFAVLASAVAARLVPTEARSRAFACAAVLIAVLASAFDFRTLTTLPTDVREAAFAVEWRDRIEAKASVVYLERAERRVAILPLYDRLTAKRVPLMLEQNFRDLRLPPPPVYFYRSSLCSSNEARRRCDELESQLNLELVTERDLEAIPSMRGLLYDRDRVHVALYRIRR